MEEDVQALKDVSYRIMSIFLNEDPVRIEEAETIEDKNRDYRNNEKSLRIDYIFFVYSNWKWEGYISCSNDLVDDPPMYFKGEIIKKGAFFTTLNITPTPGKKCNGVIDGKKISMTCENGTLVYGEIIGKTIHITNYMRSDNSTCKGSATLIR